MHKFAPSIIKPTHMKHITICTLFAITFFFRIPAFSQNIHHDINAGIDIDQKSLTITDSVKLPGVYLRGIRDTIKFYLNSNFSIKSLDPTIRVVMLKETMKDTADKVKVTKYMVLYPSTNAGKGFILPLQYSGKVEYGIKTDAIDYARGFSETPGIISKEGIYLAATTVWLPVFNDSLFTFNLTTRIDTGWGVVSQGTRTRDETVGNKKIITYKEPDPTAESYLVAAKWTEYNKQAGKTLVQAELRTPDSTLANKYLRATVGYLKMYDKLIGPYPYTKFTLVENFWETGYGMPSFTLLGEQIIRFPFILTSSYPHELLHNYWGNSVYVDNVKGNWCEGTTVYMADHLLKEQDGQGAEYRRGTLQKFTDFVNETNDFPLTKFRTRNNSAEEAIGYGKCMMMFEMLRIQYGDDLFRKSFTKFYNDNKFKLASFDEIRKSFEAVTGKNLVPFFDQWITRTGAPTLKLSNVEVAAKDNKYGLSFTVSQIQKEAPFTITVPVAIYLEGVDSVIVKNIELSKRAETFTYTYDKRPVRIDVDPQFNVFRRLDRDEVPPSLTQIFGDTDAVMILPKSSPFIKEYQDLADQWKQTQLAQGAKLQIVYDADLKELPNKATWIIGFDNKFADSASVFKKYTDILPKETMDEVTTLKKSGGLVYVYQNPKNKMLTNGFVGSKNQAMISALKRKIVHYGKYSYLGFEGDKGDNKLKGEFPTLSSPLSFIIKYDGKVIPSKAKLKVRKALVD